MFYGERIGGRGAAFANAAQLTVRLGRLGRDYIGVYAKRAFEIPIPAPTSAWSAPSTG